jgi:hypothetical protein
MMVAMGHGLCVSFCVCGETTKNKVGPKKRDGALELLGRLTVSDTYKEVKDGLKVTKCWCGWSLSLPGRLVFVITTIRVPKCLFTQKKSLTSSALE